MKFHSLSILSLALASTLAGAAGFSLYEASPSGVADTAGATAKGGRAADLYYNPATMSALTGTVVQAGSFFIRPTMTVEATNPYTGERYRHKPASKIWPIPHAYIVHQAARDWWVGLGVFSRTGLGADFKDDWLGRYNSTDAEILSANLNPNVAWKPADWLTLSVGIEAQYFVIDLRQSIDAAGLAGLRRYNDPAPSPYDVVMKMHGEDWKFGWNAGLKIDPTDRIHFGLAYHNALQPEAHGEVTFDVPAPIRAAYPAYFPHSFITGHVGEPAYWMGSLAVDATDRLTLGIGVTYTEWSSWDNLCIIMHDDPMMPGHDRLQSRKEWNDVWRFSAGGSYRISDAWTVRASFTYDDSPIQKGYEDYLVPADTREIFAMGASYATGPWTLDATYFYEYIRDFRSSARVAEGVFDGSFKDGRAHSIAFSVSRQF